MLLQDTHLLETLAHFNREPIPERVVHASAVGAWGEFEVTHDNSDLTSADWLTGVGKKSKVLARISTVGANKGSAETTEGNQDFVFNSMVSRQLHPCLSNYGLTHQPAFFIRDPIKFPSLNRAHKRLPDKNIPDASMVSFVRFA
jgi:catalase